MRAALKLGVHIPLSEIKADEFTAMLIIDEERDKFDQEKSHPNGSQ
jgi:hypothetical protein